MSIARHHIEWLSLVEASGPFLALPVLMQAFPQGLPTLPADRAADLADAFAEHEAEAGDEALHAAWIRFVLHDLLAWPADRLVDDPDLRAACSTRVAAHDEQLAPDLVLLDAPAAHIPATPAPAASAPAAAADRTDPGAPLRPRLLVQIHPPAQHLESAVPGRAWKASPATRMTELLHANDTLVGLVTNGEHWMLVHAPRGETTTYVSWRAALFTEEPLTLRAFCALAGAARLFGVPDDDTLEALFRRSAEHQHDVTDQLGMQVRAAVEIFIRTLGALDESRSGALLAGVPPSRVYEAAVTVMMRLVFVLSAEERALLLLGNAIYDRHYAASTLAATLREAADRHGEEVLERRHDAWARLCALFRALHGGIRHEDLLLPAYGGDLFDPDRFPFLEGRAPGEHWRTSDAPVPAIDNRTVLHLLESLQYLEAPVARGLPPERRRLSFRALDIEQIGHVYESLLDHTVRRAPADAPVLGCIGARGDEPEIPLADLERLCGPAPLPPDAPLPPALADHLVAQTGRSASALERLRTTPVDLRREALLRAACAGDDRLLARVLPFAFCIRDDSFGRPLVIRGGGWYVTQGSDRRQTGTHYTPRTLTAEVVRHALDPLVYEGVVEGRDSAAWRLRPARDILALRICDIAVGSAAFLVQACRHLAERLVEAWERDGESGLPADAGDRLVHARRMIAERCLYGVDVNPLAVQMARLSLWLITLAREKPFTFLDHAIKCGDSLFGFTTRAQVALLAVHAHASEQLHMWEGTVEAAMTEAERRRVQIESFVVTSVADAERKRSLLRDSERVLDLPRAFCDMAATAALVTADGRQAARGALPPKEYDQHRRRILALADAPDGTRLAEAREQYRQLREEGNPRADQPRRPFHWPLEFPEILAAGGFDAVIGNPPFLGGKRITGPLGKDYRTYLQDVVASGRKGNADLSAFFLLRAGELLRDGGMLGMLATNTIAQGDTREVALDAMTAAGYRIVRAVRSRKWPGAAALEIAQLWMRRGPWRAPAVLDDAPVAAITPHLTEPGRISGKPMQLAANLGKSFIGSYVLGMGFVLEPAQAQALLDRDPRNRDVLFPYLNGEDLNTRPDQSPSRWVINFHDWPLERAMEYPDVFRIIDETVKPERQRLKPDGTYALRKPLPQRWWHYADKRPALYSAIHQLSTVLAVSQTTKYLAFNVVPTGIVYMHTLVLIAVDDFGYYTLLNSTIHQDWVLQHGSRLETRPRYIPTDCFETFAFPLAIESLAAVGARYSTHRSAVMLETQLGLTATYNRFHDLSNTDAAIVELRSLHREMDHAVATAYGWSDLDLGHDHHPTDQGTRYTIHPEIRREILSRLLELNHQRAAAEQKLSSPTPRA